MCSYYSIAHTYTYTIMFRLFFFSSIFIVHAIWKEIDDFRWWASWTMRCYDTVCHRVLRHVMVICEQLSLNSFVANSIFIWRFCRLFSPFLGCIFVLAIGVGVRGIHVSPVVAGYPGRNENALRWSGHTNRGGHIARWCCRQNVRRCIHMFTAAPLFASRIDQYTCELCAILKC